MKAFIVKADTAQSITQWYWRTPTSSRYRELSDQTSHTAEHVVVNLLSRGSTYRQPSITKGAMLSCDVGRSQKRATES